MDKICGPYQLSDQDLDNVAGGLTFSSNSIFGNAFTTNSDFGIAHSKAITGQLRKILSGSSIFMLEHLMGSSIMLIVRSGLTKPAKKAMLFLFRPSLPRSFGV